MTRIMESQRAEDDAATIDAASIPDLVIVTGMSGAGRTEAMHVLEDLGFYCVDNLPANLIENMIDLNFETSDDSAMKKLALVCDARNGDYFKTLISELDSLAEKGIGYKVLFLDAQDEKLVSRYKSSRRRHPLFLEGTTIAQGIQRERTMLMELKDRADFVIDTTNMLPQKLRDTIRSLFASGNERKGLAVTVYSFGFKHGAPTDADLVIDVRFLPNPYYDQDLRALTGLDSAVRDFVMLRDETIEFLHRWQDLLDVLMPGYVKEGKQQLAIAVGCTGGQHRSVALAEATGDYLKAKGYRVSVAHRDLGLAQKRFDGAEEDESPDCRK